MSLHTAAVEQLSRWRAPSADQDALREQYLAHLADHPDGLLRTGPPAHLTASCLVVDPEFARVLLTLHRKGRFWVQFGGHCEPGDTDLAATALREGLEESGLDVLTLLPEPVDLHRHALSAAFGRCREHLDVGFVALAADGATPVSSHESEDVAWWPVDALPDGAVADLPGRLAAARAAVAAAAGGQLPDAVRA